VDVYIGPGGVLTGSARMAQEASEAARELQQQQEATRRQAAMRRKRQDLEAQIRTLQEELQMNVEETEVDSAQEVTRLGVLSSDRANMQRSRQSDALTREGEKKNHG